MKRLIFVDMDGVLTDFDRQFEVYTGSSPTSYQQTHGAEAFYHEIDEFPVEFWSEMSWTSSGKQLLGDLKQKIADDEQSDILTTFKILTTAFKSNSRSVIGKRQWLMRELGVPALAIDVDEVTDIDNMCFINLTHPKSFYAQVAVAADYSPDSIILVDDYGKNCREFAEAGFKTIKFTNSEYKDIKQQIDYV